MLAFHARDETGTDARVVDHTIFKGICWDGTPALISIKCAGGFASAQLAIDGRPSATDRERLVDVVTRMMGLNQPVEEFERTYQDHPVLGKMIAMHPGLRIPAASSPFEAVTWAVVGQQISLAAAISIRRRLVSSLGQRHSCGLICHPSPNQIAISLADKLTAAGLSHAKAATLLNLANQIETRTLALETEQSFKAPEAVGEALLRLNGIGQWTVSYTLLRGYGYLDGSLHGDAALRRSMQMQPGLPATVSEDSAKEWLAQFSPWRALVAAHLWAMLGVQA